MPSDCRVHFVSIPRSQHSSESQRSPGTSVNKHINTNSRMGDFRGPRGRLSWAPRVVLAHLPCQGGYAAVIQSPLHSETIDLGNPGSPASSQGLPASVCGHQHRFPPVGHGAEGLPPSRRHTRSRREVYGILQRDGHTQSEPDAVSYTHLTLPTILLV